MKLIDIIKEPEDNKKFTILGISKVSTYRGFWILGKYAKWNLFNIGVDWEGDVKTIFINFVTVGDFSLFRLVWYIKGIAISFLEYNNWILIHVIFGNYGYLE